jgi:hypothetical protein
MGPQGLEVVIGRMTSRDPARRFREPIEVFETLAPWTATPIPPPAEAEMPRLSPVARGDP